ncbi:hypothetical protein EMIHUDRAFT_432313 [Emiliania huxleyi CCMP1516]|uniref:Secreted protein n=2 Tax=Emiliania huxleyi TaxID=2903 RepID=A0A0D3J3X1_EMIH1|nr:hypothetical protein EMIHUDRAFT_432313 [Emiliania huxleyi CCMP1516]EOD18206.1 hypothetical protein EMIHUDRAFT_432313 [Emiliania huxleyi CCMP1516]|eukprot:XP_005770635.1 hypothetical protein EMIHUDRAFT_432313 [Emiliania huxleyi CCMP1516]
MLLACATPTLSRRAAVTAFGCTAASAASAPSHARVRRNFPGQESRQSHGANRALRERVVPDRRLCPSHPSLLLCQPAAHLCGRSASRARRRLPRCCLRLPRKLGGPRGERSGRSSWSTPARPRLLATAGHGFPLPSLRVRWICAPWRWRRASSWRYAMRVVWVLFTSLVTDSAVRSRCSWQGTCARRRGETRRSSRRRRRSSRRCLLPPPRLASPLSRWQARTAPSRTCGRCSSAASAATPSSCQRRTARSRTASSAS